MEKDTSWEAAGRSATQRVSQQFMETEGSLSCSQEPSTCLYPEPEKSSQEHPSRLFKIYLNIIHAYTYWSS
jgi:hypothetical protein